MDPIASSKLALRDQVLTARGRLPLAELSARAHAMAQALMTMPEVRHAATIAAYVSVGREPGTGPLLAAARSSGKHLLLPVLLPDNDLDWVRYDGPESLAPASRGLLEPVGERRGPTAVATADVVVVPGIAVDGTGLRLGRGGGSYDRALARVPVGTPTIVLLNSGEVLEQVPAQAHDRRVTAVVTERGVRRFSGR